MDGIILKRARKSEESKLYDWIIWIWFFKFKFWSWISEAKT